MLRTAHQYLHYRDVEAEAKKAKPNSEDIKKYIAENGEENGNHIDWLFPSPVTIGSATYRGLRNQGKPDTFMDEDKARELVEAKNLRDKVVREVTTEVWDWDELYVLNQQGLISDDEIDSLMTTEIKYSLVVIK